MLCLAVSNTVVPNVKDGKGASQLTTLLNTTHAHTHAHTHTHTHTHTHAHAHTHTYTHMYTRANATKDALIPLTHLHTITPTPHDWRVQSSLRPSRPTKLRW